MEKYMKFMFDSNSIEGEYRINPGDEKAIDYVMHHGIDDLEDILMIHRMLGEYLHKRWVGRWRECNVRVGGYVAPTWKNVPRLMSEFMNKFYDMKSWEAHNKFQTIHPFRDLNGRVGRLLWLSKAVYEGYYFRIPFLQAYYYQTLNATVAAQK